MNKKNYFLLAAIAGIFLVAAIKRPKDKSMIVGTPAIHSISALAFGPDGTLFIGDSKSATIFAVKTPDTKKSKTASYDIKNIDQKIASALGTEVKNITITDMCINPVSKALYLAVQHSDGTPVLLKLSGGQLQSFPLKDVTYSSVTLNNAPAEDAKDQRGRPLRISSISDIGYAGGNLMVSGLSNKEFSSSFKSIPYPFTGKQHESTLEIYHAAHGRYETSAPIKTFTTAAINGRQYLVASYTCTPLVLFPLDELKPGHHVKGRTVAEMGSGNTPIDMVSVTNNKAPYLVMANTKHPVAKIHFDNIARFEGTLTDKVTGTAGVPFTATPLTNVMQLDKIGENTLVMIQKKMNGDVDLWTANDTNL